MALFVISKQESGNYRFTFTLRKGNPVLTGISCREKPDCEAIIAAMKEHIGLFTITRKHTPSGRYFFRLSRGGLVLATSRKFTTLLRLSKAIENVTEQIAEAEILDFSGNEDVFAGSSR